MAYKSRTQFYRTFRALIEETPGEMRRRVLLERAGWRLSRTAASITEIALDADYGSLEAFTRFRRAFGASPSIYRRMGEPYYHLPAPNSIHFGAAVESTKEQLWISMIFSLDTTRGTRSNCFKPLAA